MEHGRSGLENGACLYTNPAFEGLATKKTEQSVTVLKIFANFMGKLILEKNGTEPKIVNTSNRFSRVTRTLCQSENWQERIP